MKNQIQIRDEQIRQLILKNFKIGSISKFENSWREGVQLSSCHRLARDNTKLFLVKEIKSVIDYIDANKTLAGSDILEAVEFIIEDYWLYTLDEIVHVIRSMKKDSGYFERLKYPEIKKKLDDYFNSESRIKKIENYNLRFKNKELDKKEVKLEPWKSREEYEAAVKAGQITEKKIQEQKDLKKEKEADYNNFKANYLTSKKK